MQAQLVEDRIAPLVGAKSNRAGVSGVGVLADPFAAQAIGHEFGKIDPRKRRIVVGEFVRIELVQRVNAENLNAGQRIQSRGG